MWDGAAVRARVRGLGESDPGLTRSGAETHRYAMGAPLGEAEVRGFESAHGIRLPGAYRAFVVGVGNGPAGPHHGLLPLTTPRPEAGDDWAVDGEWEDDRRPGRLAAPFPLSGPRPGPLGPVEAEEWTRGTLTLAEQGCGMFSRLVLNGPYAGEVWGLDPDWGGFVPQAPDFRGWYTAWLEQA
ncbi:SMI1/KNR4 family protein [Streptomyces sp. ISL-86]|uniref:SMI1/KNR4 family protein n=1 Tax=Streptomyces sp. ISL-86 TaxID=2819187 RepID=UPI001BE73993|nr:SMI1/KNR4 family protein [Streptomyces sp. ISL-86]MBT2453453.1 SMI1/KNR4 family protein [Streptomyces sp. ISL-86]